jgi:hypothetical protein
MLFPGVLDDGLPSTWLHDLVLSIQAAFPDMEGKRLPAGCAANFLPQDLGQPVFPSLRLRFVLCQTEVERLLGESEEIYMKSILVITKHSRRFSY